MNRLEELKKLRQKLKENIENGKFIAPNDALNFHKLGIPFYPGSTWGEEAMFKIIDYEIEKIRL